MSAAWRAARRLLAAAVVTGIAAAGAAAYLLGSPAGSERLLRTVLGRTVDVSQLSMGRVTGSLWRGLTIERAAIPFITGWDGVGPVRVGRIELSPLSFAPTRLPDVEMHDVQAAPIPMADALRIGRLVRRAGAPLELWDIQLDRVRHAPPGSRLDIQYLKLDRPYGVRRAREVRNATLRLPDAEPVLLYGTQDDAQLALRLYTKTADLTQVLGAFGLPVQAWRLEGRLNDVDLTITESFDAPKFGGHFTIRKLSRGAFAAENGSVTLALQLDLLRFPPALTGRVSLLGGALRSRQTLISLQPGAFTFDGDPVRPRFDLTGSSRIGGTTVQLSLTGRWGEPEFRLRSSPPQSEAILLAMLATGREWKGAQEALSQGAVSSDLAVDFFDYFVFGGAGERLAHKLGLSGVALKYDHQHNRVGVETTIADRLTVGVGTDVDTVSGARSSPSAAEPAPAIPYTVGAEVMVNATTAVQLEGQGAIRQSATSGAPQAGASTTAAGPGDQTEERVLLKLKKTF